MSDRAAVASSVTEWRKALPAAARHLRAAVRGEQGIGALLIRGASAGVLLTGFNTLATFGTAILLARALGVEHYGIYAYAISWITLLGVFAKAGIDQVMVRNIAVYHQAGDWAHIRGMLRFGLGLVSATGVLCALAAAALAWLLHADAPAMRNALWVACLLLPLQAFTVPFGATQNGLRQIVNAQLPGLLIVPLAFLLAIGVMYLLLPPPGFTADQALAARAAAVVIGLGAATLLLRRGLRQAGRPASLPKPQYQADQWWRSAVPLVLMGSMFMVNANADILMLGSLAGAEEAGLYKAVARGAELVTFSMTLVNAPLGPLLARLHAAKDRARMQRVLKLSALAAFAPAAVVAAALIWGGDWYLKLFGSEFQNRQAAASLAILSIGQLVNVASGSVALLLIMMQAERYVAGVLALSTAINIFLNAALIPSLGLIGAAIATAVSTILWNLLLVVFVVRRFGLDPTVLPTRALFRGIE